MVWRRFPPVLTLQSHYGWRDERAVFTVPGRTRLPPDPRPLSGAIKRMEPSSRRAVAQSLPNSPLSPTPLSALSLRSPVSALQPQVTAHGALAKLAARHCQERSGLSGSCPPIQGAFFASSVESRQSPRRSLRIRFSASTVFASAATALCGFSGLSRLSSHSPIPTTESASPLRCQ